MTEGNPLVGKDSLPVRSPMALGGPHALHQVHLLLSPCSHDSNDSTHSTRSRSHDRLGSPPWASHAFGTTRPFREARLPASSGGATLTACWPARLRDIHGPSPRSEERRVG